MSIKNSKDKRRQKEVQKFFSKVKQVMLVPKLSEFLKVDYPVVCLIVDEDTYLDFRKKGINKMIVEQLDDKYPILSIRAPENSYTLGLSIKDIKGTLSFSMPEQPMGNALLKFVEVTKPDDKMPVMLGYFNGDTLVLDQVIKNNFLIVIDGFVFEE